MSDEKIEHKPNTKSNPVNWSVLGINTEGFDKNVEKEPTDRPPEDINQADLMQNQTKLPPKIVTHDSDGKTTGEHDANDQNFNNKEVEDLKDPAVNSQTPMVVGSEASENNRKQEEVDAARNKPPEGNNLPVQNATSANNSAPPGTPLVAPSASIPVTPAKPAAVQKDPNLVVR